jgi:hypothetical protein
LSVNVFPAADQFAGTHGGLTNSTIGFGRHGAAKSIRARKAVSSSPAISTIFNRD